MFRLPNSGGRPLSVSGMWPDVEIKDITEMVDSRIYKPIPADRHDVIKIGIIGDLGFGKTSLLRCLAKKTADYYGPDNINVIYENDIDQALLHVDTLPIQFIVIDDASGKQNSRRSIENADKVQNVMMLRHTAATSEGREEGTTGGIVFLFWLWQYYMMLDKNFRTKLQYLFMKGYEIDHDYDYTRFVGGYADTLKKNTDKIEKGDQDAKNYSLCAIPALFQDGNRFSGRGMYRAYYVSKRDFPQIPDSKPVNEKPKVKPIDQLFSGIDQEQLFRAREITWMLNKGMTQTEAGAQWGLSQPDVSKLLKWYRDLAGIKEYEEVSEETTSNKKTARKERKAEKNKAA